MAAAPSGDFVVAWTSEQDGSDYGVFAQRFAVPHVLDIDGDGTTSALKDGLLFLRRLFGFTGATLVAGVVGDGCTRCDAPAIESYIGGLISLPPGTPEIRLGAELQVHSYTTNDQANASVAEDDDGDFVVAWESYGPYGSDRGVFARRFSSAGVALATELQVNSHAFAAVDFQALPSVAANGAGDFVVVWQSYGEDGSEGGVFARRFSSAGVALGVELQVNSYTTSIQWRPAVAADADGNFVVVWSSYGQDSPDNTYDGIFAQRFSSAGIALATEFQVTPTPTTASPTPRWRLLTPATSWSPGAATARTVKSPASLSGASPPRGPPSPPSSRSIPIRRETRRSPWRRLQPPATSRIVYLDESGAAVFARRFSSAGTALATELPRSTRSPMGTGPRRPSMPTATSWSPGKVVKATTGRSSSSRPDGSPLPASPSLKEFQVNSYTPESQIRPSVAAARAGHFTVAWQSDGQDGSGLFGVFAQSFGAPTAILDIDGNGSVGALTDGLLLLRYLFDFTGATLVAERSTSAVAPGAPRPRSRCTLAGLG